MRTSYVITSILLILSFAVNAQIIVPFDRPVRIVRMDKKPLLIVDNIRTESNHLIMDPNSIEAVTVLKDSISVSEYGQAGKYGVVIVSPKKAIRLLQLSKILHKYNLAEYQNKLKVCINKILMPNPDLILIEETEIINVEITPERIWTNIEDANSNEKFINIIVKTRNKSGL